MKNVPVQGGIRSLLKALTTRLTNQRLDYIPVRIITCCFAENILAHEELSTILKMDETHVLHFFAFAWASIGFMLGGRSRWQ